MDNVTRFDEADVVKVADELAELAAHVAEFIGNWCGHIEHGARGDVASFCANEHWQSDGTGLMTADDGHELGTLITAIIRRRARPVK